MRSPCWMSRREPYTTGRAVAFSSHCRISELKSQYLFLDYLLNLTRPMRANQTMSNVEGSAINYLFCLVILISLKGDSRLALRTIVGQIWLSSTAIAKHDTTIRPPKMSRTRILR
jgi:hypothetical protein